MKKNSNTKNKKPKIMLIPAQLLPIPGTKGGVEVLISNMMKVNEKENKVDFIVMSIFDEKASQQKFNHSKVYYFSHFKSLDFKIRFFGTITYIFSFMLVIFKKIIFNRYTKRFFKKGGVPFPSILLHQYLLICKIEKVDYVVNESSFLNPILFAPLIKYVGRDHFYYRIHNMAPVGTIEERTIFTNTIACSDYGRNKWISGCHVSGDNRTVYHGVDLDNFSKPTPEVISDLRCKLEINESDKVLFYCGRIVPLKGVEELLNAFEKIQDKNVVLLVAGDASLATGSDQEYFKRMVEKMSKNKRIRYLGHIPNDQLAIYYGLVNIQIIPSLCEEAAGLVSIEGMASGVPLIVTKSGGMIEYVDDDCAVILPRDKELVTNLTNAIDLLLSDDKKMSVMSEHGKERAKLFSKENNYNSFIDIFLK